MAQDKVEDDRFRRSQPAAVDASASWAYVVAVAARGDSTMRMKHLGSGERVLSAEECGVVLSMSMAAGAHTCF